MTYHFNTDLKCRLCGDDFDPELTSGVVGINNDGEVCQSCMDELSHETDRQKAELEKRT